MEAVELRSLFSAFLEGDNDAFAEIYRELNPRLSAYCHKLAPAYADDLMQELWEKVIGMRSKKAVEVQSPTAFLFRMLRNITIDHVRRTDETAELKDEHIASEHEATDFEMIIVEALEKLPAEEREILVLNIYSGYKFGEIAEMLEMSVEAVWQRASRARTKLRAIVEADAAQQGIGLPSKKSREKEIA